jgi:hypothetical protein
MVQDHLCIEPGEPLGAFAIDRWKGTTTLFTICGQIFGVVAHEPCRQRQSLHTAYRIRLARAMHYFPQPDCAAIPRIGLHQHHRPELQSVGADDGLGVCEANLSIRLCVRHVAGARGVAAFAHIGS